MAKYIRTKTGIYDFEEQRGNIENRGEKSFLAIGNDYRGCTCYDYEEIIDQADTIEELCDYFLIDKNDIEHYEPTTLLIFDDYDDFRYSMFGYENASGYGCIKTDKGLIYVAKMVDEKLVLI